MPSFDSYNAKTTSISYPWPAEVNGVERIALSAQGDLQRVLSAFFARPIVIALVYSNTSRQSSPEASFEPITQVTPAIIAGASPETPIVQTRQVHLQCNGRIVCTATSTVRITSPETAHLFLQEKYAIGQMFRRLEKVPAFELLCVGLGAVREGEKRGSFKIADADRGSSQLWRKYTLIVPHFECEILEVFPAREMFLGAERWLTGDAAAVPELAVAAATRPGAALNQGLKIVIAAGVMLLLLFETAVVPISALVCYLAVRHALCIHSYLCHLGSPSP
ncbi:hypothetical protein HYPSUDRAFT_37154 [Hypholoma sublateritium FD-334 SS-4]|uniref:Uncharacterized protein n=1 Tax=Hypholoma sublateritium (strain FD-334 SS-4) TaxID=945553 RepID=A0A0D2Q2E6_HYPSF|nr:hypothetical protein HYPSUDRAFT_37154 [Hypholoma sublateritium FD-334 SS-4]